MRDIWKELGRELTGLVLPGQCAGCGLPGVRGVLCTHCGNTLRNTAPARVPPSALVTGAPAVWGAIPYADEVRAVLLAHKERGTLGLAAPLGAALASAAAIALRELRPAAAPGEPLTLVPVPSSRRSVAARGHDPARRTALAAARTLRRHGTPARALAVLRQRRAVADQSGLTAHRRAANLHGALTAMPASRNLLPQQAGTTLLVDDLVTTGSSLTEAARALSAAGGRAAGAAVVAVAR